MTKVSDLYKGRSQEPTFICDFSPPRGADVDSLRPAAGLDVDFVSVAYNPGRSVRVNSVLAALWIKQNTGKDVIFTLATRDMNKVAVQSLLLGAALAGLENLVVVRGDDFTERDLERVRPVHDFQSTDLLRSVAEMNAGTDFKSLKLGSATDLCAGATIDMGRPQDFELELTRRKADAGAQFFISQPTFDPGIPRAFLDRYAERYGVTLDVPVFFGVQVMSGDGIVFGNVPQWVTDDLSKGRPGPDIAAQVLSGFFAAGLKSIYLVPPILRGGRRDYDAARATLESIRS